MTDEYTFPGFIPGYNYDQAVIDKVESAMCAGNPSALDTSAFFGNFEKKKKFGYYNQMDNVVAFFADGFPKGYIATGQDLLPSGTLRPVLQRTGICNGCSHKVAAFVSWVSAYMELGDPRIPMPQDVSLVAPYLCGRLNLRGDTGAYPSPTVQAYHDIGLLTVADLADVIKRKVDTITSEVEEKVAVDYRDRPMLFPFPKERMANYRVPVFRPKEQGSLLDCLANGYPVTCGMTMQLKPPSQGSRGVSALYNLGGGHETFFCGWFTLNGRVGVIQMNSWGNFPADNIPDHRVTLETDAGPKKLHVGQAACWVEDLVRARGEWWGIGYPMAS